MQVRPLVGKRNQMETSKLKNLKILTSYISLNHLSLQKWHISPYLKDSTFPFLEGNSETSPPKDNCPSGCFFNLLLDTRPVTRVKLHHSTALDVLKLIREAKDHSLKKLQAWNNSNCWGRTCRIGFWVCLIKEVVHLSSRALCKVSFVPASHLDFSLFPILSHSSIGVNSKDIP